MKLKILYVGNLNSRFTHCTPSYKNSASTVNSYELVDWGLDS
jgi:hypothetical protein